MRKGFTLLELIVVIIIAGVLASIALPRLFAMVERARATEAVVALGTIRRAIERCSLMQGGTYPCLIFAQTKNYAGLAIDDPFSSPGSHFEFRFMYVGPETPAGSGNYPYTIIAKRNTRDVVGSIPSGVVQCPGMHGVAGISGIGLCHDVTTNTIYFVGGGFYEGLKL